MLVKLEFVFIEGSYPAAFVGIFPEQERQLRGGGGDGEWGGPAGNAMAAREVLP